MKRLLPVVLALSMIFLLFCGFTSAESESEMVTITYDDMTPSGATAPTQESSGVYPKAITPSNQNGIFTIQKVYEVPQGTDPKSLIEQDFEENGYTYTHSDTLENVLPSTTETKLVSEMVTLETEKNDKAEILQSLEPIIDYNQEGFSGQLSMDSGSLVTEATGYSSYSYTVTGYQEYSPLDRNDPYYMTKSKNQNGVGMHLVDVEWSAYSETIIGDSLVPTAYNGNAIYEGVATGYTANGYVTTVNYMGTVEKELQGNVEYTLIYKGTEIVVEKEIPKAPIVVGATVFSGGAFLFVFLFFLKRNTKIYNLMDEQYILIGKQRMTKEKPIVDLAQLRHNVSSNAYMIVLDNSISRSLFGRNVVVEGGSTTLTHRVAGNDNYSFEVVL